MTNYNLLVLSPDEFEDLSRDLLQSEFNIFFESFTTGKDGGIDFRYAHDNQNVVLQCKRYESLDNLKKILKKEAVKSVVKNASRYILTTSVKLTPQNKDDILNILNGVKITSSDIFGYDDIINLLSKNENVEKKYYKLWLCNTKVIDRILNANIINQSEFKREKIERNIKIFVQNGSYNEALNILKDLNFVIISGIPGIGKTTLAEFLAYHYLKQGYEDFVYLTESIRDGFKAFDKDRKQVFLFDDFLGSRFLISNMSNNEDKRIVEFVNHIRNFNNKKLIFTTREYILKQANNELERLKEIETNSKCIVDLSNYTKYDKAKILYNHLFWNNVPLEYIASLLKGKVYKVIINHPNYSPRLIDSITKKNVLRQQTPNEYVKNFIKYLDNPIEVWYHSFTSNISELSQQILIVAQTTQTPILESDLKLAVDSYRSRIFDRSKTTTMEMKKALKELDDSFIKTSKSEDGETIIQFHNPSIQDFLSNYLSDNSEIVSDLIKSTYFFNQYLAGYSTNKDDHKIYISPKILNELLAHIASDINNTKTSSIIVYPAKSSNSGLVSYRRQKKSITTSLSYILKNASICNYDPSAIGIEQIFKKISIDEMTTNELDDYIYILKYIVNVKKEPYNLSEIFEKLFSCVNSISDLLVYGGLKEIDESLFEDIISTNIDSISEIVNNDINNATPDQYDDIENLIQELSTLTRYDFDDSIEMLKEMKFSYYDREPDEDDYIRAPEDDEENPDTIIDNLFGSLNDCE